MEEFNAIYENCEEPVKEIEGPCRDWKSECLHYEVLYKRLDHQCKFYEEEIKMLHDRIDTLKIALVNIVTHAVK